MPATITKLSGALELFIGPQFTIQDYHPVKLLLEANADPNILYYAIFGSYEELQELLVRYEATLTEEIRDMNNLHRKRARYCINRERDVRRKGKIRPILFIEQPHPEEKGQGSRGDFGFL